MLTCRTCRRFGTKTQASQQNRSREEARVFIQELTQKLGLSHPERDWNRLTTHDIANHGGSHLLKEYKFSVYKILIDAFPEYSWCIWQFRGETPASWWKEPANKRIYLDWATKQLSLHTLSEWYRIKPVTISSLPGGKAFLRNNRYDLTQSLKEAYPEHKWEECGFLSGYSREQIADLFKEVMPSLGVSTMTDWYSITSKKLMEAGGNNFKRLLNILPYPDCLMTAFPDHLWQPWMFSSLKKQWWQSLDNQRTYWQWLASAQQWKNFEDYYQATYDLVIANRGSALMRLYSSSPFRALKSAFPEHEWLPWKFKNTPTGYWEDIDNQRLFLDWAIVQLRSSSHTMEDWYSITTEELLEVGGQSLLARYGMSLATAAMEVYPKHPWQPWRFRSVPRYWWDSIENQYQYIEWLKQQLKINNMEDWYRVGNADVLQNYGAGLLKAYRQSLSSALIALYPQHEWQVWKFERTPHGWWKSRSNQLKFCEYVAKHLQFKGLEGWYELKSDDVVKLGGVGLMQLHANSLYRMLTTVYPEHEWEPWRFLKPPRKYWNQVRTSGSSATASMNSYLNALVKRRKLNIRRLSDWYGVSVAQLGSRAAKRIAEVGGLAAALKIAYPNHDWDSNKFNTFHSLKRTEQRNLLRVLSAVAPKLVQQAAISENKAQK